MKSTNLLRNSFQEYIQKSKENWWKCNYGSYHKGFPYKCLLKTFKRETRIVLEKQKKIKMNTYKK